MQPLRIRANDRALVTAGMGLVGAGLLIASLMAAWYIALLNLAGLGLLAGAWLAWRDSDR